MTMSTPQFSLAKCLLGTALIALAVIGLLYAIWASIIVVLSEHLFTGRWPAQYDRAFWWIVLSKLVPWLVGCVLFLWCGLSIYRSQKRSLG